MEEQDAGKKWKILYLSLSLLLFIGIVTGSISSWVTSDVGSPHTFLLITMISTVLLLLLTSLDAITPGILPTLIITTYALYLCVEAIASTKDPLSSTNGSKRLFNVLLSASTLTWTSWRMSHSMSSLVELKPSVPDLETPLLLSSPSTENHLPPTWQFHGIMVLGCMYMAVECTSWNPGMSTTSR